MSTTEVTVTQARDHLATTLSELRAARVIRVVNRGVPVAMLVSPEHYDALIEALEDAEDRQALAEFRADPDPDLVPWDEIRRDLGLPL